MTPSGALNLVNIALAGAVLLAAVDSAMKARYANLEPPATSAAYRPDTSRGATAERFTLTFRKDTKGSPSHEEPDISGLIRLSGVFERPSDPLKSSAVFVIRGKESVLKRAGEEIADGISLESVSAMGVVVKRGGVEATLQVEPGGAEEGGERLLITTEAPIAPQEPSDNQKAQPALVTSDPGQKIVKPIQR